jgi:hypothetical protein
MLRSADRREEVVADGVADDDEWASFEFLGEIATAEVDKVKDESIDSTTTTCDSPRRRRRQKHQPVTLPVVTSEPPQVSWSARARSWKHGSSSAA